MDIASAYHVGLTVYDPQKDKWIFKYKDDNFFTPASNIKILTMYASLLTLSDHLDAAYYVTSGDSLIIWGGGDPGTLFPNPNSNSNLVDFIKASNLKIVFSTSHFMTQRFGEGWAWDDYPYTYQCERTAFPISGNRMWLERKENNILITPRYLIPMVAIQKDSITTAGKTEWGDRYFYNYNPQIKEEKVQIPITFFKNDLQYSWAEASGKEILVSNHAIPVDHEVLAGTNRDTLIKIMMQESDNFIAEQLLLVCSMKALGYMAEKPFIDSMMKGPLRDMPDTIDWTDGSGLSRYNRVTPRSIVWALQQILKMEGLDYIKAIFPAGGVSGTIKEYYKGVDGVPYVFAKTGTLGHVHCLSGYLLTRSGKVLLFSWMHNQFSGSSREVKRDMEKLFLFLYHNY